ncbi:hypothetical protein FO519_005386 [Halicephalobus sp. NKZ332]|nr:hypothetical protein FO519_005386 [Halicephalobus sp. NKZ332]
MAAISANSFTFPGMNNNRLPIELLELLKDQPSTINPLLFNNEFTRLLLQQKMYAQLASQGNRMETGSPVATMVSNESTPILKRTFSKSPEENQNSSPDAELEEKPRKRSRIGGQSVKTAEVWRFFKQIPNEQAATCSICSKTIKATNSSTTGMIRHLRSCHTAEHEVLQNARRQNFLRKGLKSGVLDGEQLNEFALLQQMEQANKDHGQDSDTVSDTVESIAASTSSISSDNEIKSSHTIEKLIGSVTQDLSSKNILEKCLSRDDDQSENTPIQKPAKRGRPPKITCDENSEKVLLQNKINNELITLFSLGVLPVEVMDNLFFRNFLRNVAPDFVFGSAAEFRSKIVPSLANSGCNTQAFLKNNHFLKTPTSRKGTRISYDGKGPSPAPTNESGFHDEDDHASNDQCSVNDSIFSDILNLCTSTNNTPEQRSEAKSPSPALETASVESDSGDKMEDRFERLFQDLLDHIGQDIFPKDNLHLLLGRLYEAYEGVKKSSLLCKEVGKEFNVFDDIDLDEIVARKIANDSGIEVDASPSPSGPRLLKCISFGVNSIPKINELMKNNVLSFKKEFDTEDQELLAALYHHITNPDC